MFQPVVPGELASLIDGVRALSDADSVPVSPAERAARLAGIRTLINASEALFTQTLETFDAGGDGEILHGAASTQAWLRGALRLAPGDASERVKMARGCRGAMREAIDAMSTGHVTYDQVRAISRAIKLVPPAAVEESVSVLTELARNSDVVAVRTAGQHLQNAVNPDGALAESNDQFERRWLTLSPLLDNVTSVSGILDPESAAMLSAALAPFLVPNGPDDFRTTPQRRADGLVELARACSDHALLPELATERPHLDVICTLDALTGVGGSPAVNGLKVGTTVAPRISVGGSDVVLTAQAVARIACDASVGRVLLSPDSLELDLGRRQRLFSMHQRRALAIRDGGCRFPGCHRQPRFTEAHHIVHWAHGGASDLANAVLLCRHHHRIVHEGGWWIETTLKSEGANGLVNFAGPAFQRLASSPRGP